MENTETVTGAVAELGQHAELFWPVLDADDQIPDDERAEIVLLMEGVQDNLAEIKRTLHRLSEEDA